MANINELEWVTPEGENYPVATTTIGGEEAIILKYDEDSFIINGENEANLEQLTNILERDSISVVVGTLAELTETYVDNKVELEISNILNPSGWKKVKGIGEQVIEIPHAMEAEGVTLRIIKLDEDSFKIAVIGIPPNDGEEIHYAEVDLSVILMNYSYALGYGTQPGEDYYQKLKTASEQTEHTDFEIVHDAVPNEVPCVGCH